ncbi:hypothetical protein BT96DRAFT_677039 [Gymnopus androsaceus JB14]|uniref:Uncharacterized protein n=1 Tax=Gymnopus androsaceus JB14 TaxID=1447944 RepID=A0A6A4HPK0_9AGAR|nr:hypothetical protein BT96DRAFT_677039 [Gymnopus androsaceus JB14]
MGHKVPLLLESFPVPPSFIPPSSATSPYFNQSSVSGHSNEGSSPKSTTPPLSSAPSNPPPSLPPSGPLPPVPGRSRISEHDAAFFLQSSRNSRHSTHSSHSNSSRPDSVASFASARSNGASYAYGKRITPEVQVDDTDDTSQAYGGLEDPVQLTSLRISPMPPSPTGSDEHEIPTSLSSQFPTPPPLSPFAYQQANAMRRSAQWSAPPSPLSPARRPASPNDSLAEISMHDLPSADEGAESEWDVPTTRPITLKPLDIRHAPSSFTAPIPSRSESRSSLKRMSRISVDNVDSVSLRAAIAPSPDPPLLTSSPNPSTPPLTASSSTFSAPDSDDVDPHRELHRELRSARSRSRSHRERLGLSPTSTPPVTSTEFNWPPMPPIPSVTTAPNTSAMSVSESRTTGSDDGGRASPDIQSY